MKLTDVSWTSTDGLPLVGRCWEPESEPRAVVCLVHGLGASTAAATATWLRR